MFRSPWELDAQVRYKTAQLAGECRHCPQSARTDTGAQGRLTRLRRRIGIGLIQVGTTIAGHDASSSQPRPSLSL
jgi:hypothetical protein